MTKVTAATCRSPRPACRAILLSGLAVRVEIRRLPGAGARLRWRQKRLTEELQAIEIAIVLARPLFAPAHDSQRRNRYRQLRCHDLAYHEGDRVQTLRGEQAQSASAEVLDSAPHGLHGLGIRRIGRYSPRLDFENQGKARELSAFETGALHRPKSVPKTAWRPLTKWTRRVP